MEKHVKSCHKEVYLNLQQQGKNATGETHLKKPEVLSLNGVQLSSLQIFLSCVRLVSEHGRPFTVLVLDDAAFRDLVVPLVAALPAKERYEA